MKFSIRDLMFLTIIVAVCTAWWLERTKLRSEVRQLKKSLATPVFSTYQGMSGRRDGLPIGDY